MGRKVGAGAMPFQVKKDRIDPSDEMPSKKKIFFFGLSLTNTLT